MECAGEGDLQARICKEGPLDEDQTRHIFAQVTAAIHHMVSPKILVSDTVDIRTLRTLCGKS